MKKKYPHELLSRREHEVMCSIALGNTPRQIAEQLTLSTKTVNTYRARILAKMHLSSTGEIIRYAIVYKMIG